MRIILFLFFFSCWTCLQAQSPTLILHFTETSGYDHQTRDSSLALFSSLPNTMVVQDNTGASFQNKNQLANYDLIVFSNTSGDAILDSTERSHFEYYIQQGGHVLGIHAASDTYRHSTANGTNKGTWDFYSETIGASVQQNPNHVAGTPSYAIRKVNAHPITINLPDPWVKNEEYYYWENGYLHPNIQSILKVDQTIGPNGMTNSYDSSRTVAFYRELNTGSKVFYTSLGHAPSNFTQDSLFKKLIQNAVSWLIDNSSSIVETKSPDIQVYPNPVLAYLNINWPGNQRVNYSLFSLSGAKIIEQNTSPLDLRKLPTGIYLLEIKSEQFRFSQKIVKSK